MLMNTGPEGAIKMDKKCKGRRKTGTAYRRAMKAKHRSQRMQILNGGGYMPWVGFIDHRTGKYIKLPSNSNAQRYLKRMSNKSIRRSDEVYRGGAYKKQYEYWWNLL